MKAFSIIVRLILWLKFICCATIEHYVHRINQLFKGISFVYLTILVGTYFGKLLQNNMQIHKSKRVPI